MGILMVQQKKEERTVLRLSSSKASEEESVWRLFPNLGLPGKMVRDE